MTLSLLSETDRMASLEEIIEFIDCWESEDADKTSGDSEGARTAPEDDEPQSPTTHPLTQIDPSASSFSSKKLKKPRKPRRKRTGWSSSTGLQRRKRAEIQFLRVYVHELDVYVEQLRKPVRQLKASWEFQSLQELAASEYRKPSLMDDLDLDLLEVSELIMPGDVAFMEIFEENELSFDSDLDEIASGDGVTPSVKHLPGSSME
ncbi:hypothetical protein KRP22_014303 [Phytophthora ramorum]|nr:hypothetical protein KRP22_9097 [Phytophthora ramorum]